MSVHLTCSGRLPCSRSRIKSVIIITAIIVIRISDAVATNTGRFAQGDAADPCWAGRTPSPSRWPAFARTKIISVELNISKLADVQDRPVDLTGGDSSVLLQSAACERSEEHRNMSHRSIYTTHV